MEKQGTPVNIKVVCVNDKGQPDEIPYNKRIIKGKKYTIIEFRVINQQNRAMGVRLAEIDLTDCFPYVFFLASRFGVLTDKGEVMEEIEELLTKIEQESEELVEQLN